MTFHSLYQRLLKFSIAAIVLLYASSAASLTIWSLDKKLSTINFYSVKKGSIGETHQFTDFNGNIMGDLASVVIKPDSVDSKIGIRDERMREFLFETKLFPAIEVRVKLSDALLGLANGSSLQKVPASLSLHGVTKDIELNALIIKTEKTITVASQQPVVVNATDYGMSEGVAKLGELVGGIDIATAVPVSFNLVFKTQ